MRPPYDIKAKCSRLRWDDVRDDWYCASTHVCYRLSSDCPLVEVCVKDVLSNRVSLKDIPVSLRSIVQKQVESNSEPVELYFF